MKLTSRTRIIHLMSGVDFPKDVTFTEMEGQCQERKIQFKNILRRYSNLIPRGRSGKGPFVLLASFSWNRFPSLNGLSRALVVRARMEVVFSEDLFPHDLLPESDLFFLVGVWNEGSHTFLNCFKLLYLNKQKFFGLRLKYFLRYVPVYATFVIG